MAQRRVSSMIMAGLGVLLLVGLFLPYVQSTTTPDLSVTVFDVVGGEVRDLVPESSKTVYTIVGVVVALGAVMALLGLTSKKVFGILSIIFSLIIAAFHGLLAGAFSEGRSVGAGMGFWLVLAVSVALCVTSFVFVLRKPKPQLA